MRVPKIRAWWEKGKRMLDIAAIDYLEKEVKSHANVMYRFDDIELMQSTGLKDKYGKEVFEGDIINYKYGRHTSTQFVVKYDEFQATFVVVDNHNDLVYTFRELADYIQLNSLEVIGNIYENKELLEEEVKDD